MLLLFSSIIMLVRIPLDQQVSRRKSLKSIFIGSGKTRAMQDTMLMATFGVFLPLWFFTRHLGNHGLWIAYLSFLSIRSLSMGGMFAYYSWQKSWLPISNNPKILD